MQAQYKLSPSFDTAAAPGYKFMRSGECRLIERDAAPMPGRSGGEGELVRTYDFSLGAPHAIQEERWHDGGRRRELTAFLPATGVDIETLAKAHRKLTELGGEPPCLDHCLNPSAWQRSLTERTRVETLARRHGNGP